jgi:hypothetical protein
MKSLNMIVPSRGMVTIVARLAISKTEAVLRDTPKKSKCFQRVRFARTMVLTCQLSDIVTAHAANVG